MPDRPRRNGPCRKRTPGEAWAELDRTRRLVVLYVADHRARHGRGPTWREVGRVFGSTHRSLDWRLVRKCGPALTHRDDVAGSLDVAPELREVAAEALDDLRRGSKAKAPA